MNASDWIPPQAVVPLAGRQVDALRHCAQRAGQAFAHVDLAGCADRTAVMRRIGEALSLPAHFGCNLDALHDCLTDLCPPVSDAPGFVFVVDGLPPDVGLDTEAREALLDVFRDAAEAWGLRHVGFRVFQNLV